MPNPVLQKTWERAEGRWPAILASLGVPEKILSKKNQPCPWCGGKDRFRFTDHEGRGSWICNHCGTGDGIRLVMQMQGLDFKTACQKIDAVLRTNPEPAKKVDEKDKIARCNRLWKEGNKPEFHDPVGLYLKARVPCIDGMPRDLRYHPGLYYDREHKHPAMLALIRGPDGKGLGLHRTFLSTGGRKADVDQPKKMLGARSISGGAVRLSPLATVLGIAEGIETAIAASAIHGIGTWACLSAVGVKSFVPPEGIEEVVVFADNDANGVGQIAAYSLMQRLHGTHTVRVILPPLVGTDWADEAKDFR